MGGGYTTQMRKLSAQLNPLGYDLVAELHFNKFDNKNNDQGVGCEAVVYPGNDYTIQAGKVFCDMVSSQYQTTNRGVKEHGKGDRGYGFLSLMEAPAIILEPFFGDEDEAEKFENPGKYAELIKEWIKCL